MRSGVCSIVTLCDECFTADRHNPSNATTFCSRCFSIPSLNVVSSLVQTATSADTCRAPSLPCFTKPLRIHLYHRSTWAQNCRLLPSHWTTINQVFFSSRQRPKLSEAFRKTNWTDNTGNREATVRTVKVFKKWLTGPCPVIRRPS